MTADTPMNASRELILTTLRRHGGEVADRTDAVARLLDLLQPTWTKRDSLVHLLLDMERDGQLERVRPSQRRTTAIRIAAEEPEPVRLGDISRREAVALVVERLDRLERAVLACLLEIHASILRHEPR